MERRVGVVRDAEGLSEAIARLGGLAETGCEAALTGLLIAESALRRQESRGAHWRSDHPGMIPARHSETRLAEVERAFEGARLAELLS
nr:hypothetical protein [Methylobacterium durans]